MGGHSSDTYTLKVFILAISKNFQISKYLIWQCIFASFARICEFSWDSSEETFTTREKKKFLT